jgi:microcompartment protein CcmK/EutM
MLIGKVVGSVVATRKDEKLENQKLLLVQVHDHKNEPRDQYVVAVDAVGAGMDEMVLYATGSRARADEPDREQALRRGDHGRRRLVGPRRRERVREVGELMYLARVIGRVVATRRREGSTASACSGCSRSTRRRRAMGDALVARAVVERGPGDLVHFVDGREGALAARDVRAGRRGDRSASSRRRSATAGQGTLMFLADVVGTVVSPVQIPILDGRSSCSCGRSPVRESRGQGRASASTASQAGVGDRVIVIDEGNSARADARGPQGSGEDGRRRRRRLRGGARELGTTRVTTTTRRRAPARIATSKEALELDELAASRGWSEEEARLRNAICEIGKLAYQKGYIVGATATSRRGWRRHDADHARRAR